MFTNFLTIFLFSSFSSSLSTPILFFILLILLLLLLLIPLHSLFPISPPLSHSSVQYPPSPPFSSSSSFSSFCSTSSSSLFFSSSSSYSSFSFLLLCLLLLPCATRATAISEATVGSSSSFLRRQLVPVSVRVFVCAHIRQLCLCMHGPHCLYLLAGSHPYQKPEPHYVSTLPVSRLSPISLPSFSSSVFTTHQTDSQKMRKPSEWLMNNTLAELNYSLAGPMRAQHSSG